MWRRSLAAMPSPESETMILRKRGEFWTVIWTVEPAGLCSMQFLTMLVRASVCQWRSSLKWVERSPLASSETSWRSARMARLSMVAVVSSERRTGRLWSLMEPLSNLARLSKAVMRLVILSSC